MKTKLLALSSFFLLGACTITPQAYYKASARVSCRTIKKCEEDQWKAGDYDNVGDCVDKFLENQSAKEFADDCDDYDRKNARKCLRSFRKAKRSCENDDIDIDACSKVCKINIPGVEDLSPEEQGRIVAEAKFAAGELNEEELEDQLDDAEFAADEEADEEELLAQEIDEIMAIED